MAFSTGARLGVYEIGSPLGAGGMGEVYRARDTKLNRAVALKILPESVVHDPDRVARFRREAQVLAALNHPHIAQIYGLEEANGTQFLVLELVDGESLAERIKRGPIPLDEALAIAKQIAEGLEAAHEKGIIHRDLKPANVAFTNDGQVKVLDFGLAKAEVTSDTSIDLANSPTLTSPAMMTSIGVILGAAAYMSPEQANGRPADKRSDVWAFGCVLYEMLTGKRAFEGETITDVMAEVLKNEPVWAHLPHDVSPALHRLLRRCLAKNPKQRLHDTGDARIEIEDMIASVVAPPDGPPAVTSSDESSYTEYHQAIKGARDRIWVCQTWLPGLERDATAILQSGVRDVKILLASFKKGSPIFARIAGRNVKPTSAKAYVESSVRQFVKHGKKECVKFSFGHHPAWIAVIDASVFWGPTPVNNDNTSFDFLFHRHSADSTKGAFWIEQFALLWESFSHEYDTEQTFNEELRTLHT